MNETKTRILFVDDEPKVLDGLQRMLRSMRNEWDIDTASSGEEALVKMERAAFDVLVSDMRMPGMDGAQLLTEVMQRYPHVIRIILSGQSDQETILRSVGPTHMYLSKPCDAALLKSTVQRVLALRGILENEELRRLISRLKTLPSLPVAYTEIIAELNKSEPSLERIGTIVARDVAMTAKIMQMVNSAFFGFYSHVSSPMQAVRILGTDKIRSLVLSAHIFSQFANLQVERFGIEALWNHSLRVGLTAKAITLQAGGDALLAEESFMAGLLHDAGRLVLVANLTGDYETMLADLKTSPQALEQAECSRFGASHAEIGAYLFGLWGLANPLLEAIAFHHRPNRAGNPHFSPLTAVHAADAIDQNSYPDPIFPPAEADAQYLESLNLGGRLLEWRKLAEDISSKEGAL